MTNEHATAAPAADQPPPVGNSPHGWDARAAAPGLDAGAVAAKAVEMRCLPADPAQDADPHPAHVDAMARFAPLAFAAAYDALTAAALGYFPPHATPAHMRADRPDNVRELLALGYALCVRNAALTARLYPHLPPAEAPAFLFPTRPPEPDPQAVQTIQTSPPTTPEMTPGEGRP